jgi:hypothetical protein
MFEFIRTHSKLMLGLIVLLIIPSFVFFGIDGYQQHERRCQHHRRRSGRAEDYAGRVGSGASAQRWTEHAPAACPTWTPRCWTPRKFSREALEQMVRERVLLAAADDARHLFPTDRAAASASFKCSDPQFARLRGPEGQRQPRHPRRAGMVRRPVRRSSRLRCAIRHGTGARPGSAGFVRWPPQKVAAGRPGRAAGAARGPGSDASTAAAYLRPACSPPRQNWRPFTSCMPKALPRPRAGAASSG